MVDVTFYYIINYGAWIIPINFILTTIIVTYIVKNPKHLVTLYPRVRAFIYGLKKKHVQCKDYRISYLERGHRSEVTPTILFVHGFSATKENWIDVIKNTSEQVNIIALDLPGHGETEYINDDLSIMFYVRILKEFVDALGLNRRKFHLAGQSMGGGIVGMYACEYPDDLISTILLCPFGIQTEEMERMTEEFRTRGRFPYLPQNMEDIENMLSTSSYNSLHIPDILKSGILQRSLERDAFNRKLLEGLIKNRDVFGQSIHKICTPLMILWGKEDQVLDVKSVEIIEKRLQSPSKKKIVILEKVGHVISLEVPKQCANLLMDFINSL